MKATGGSYRTVADQNPITNFDFSGSLYALSDTTLEASFSTELGGSNPFESDSCLDPSAGFLLLVQVSGFCGIRTVLVFLTGVMATGTPESKRLYSWWWDSHISPKNSKWLQENLTDMDAKVKAMIKLIEEDADSFARRAEMYYKKRPELMKLVEEFYRAYRALAERYDHATGELRQAHRTIAEAFPNRVPFVLADDSPSGSSITEAEPHTPETPHSVHAFFDPDDIHKDSLGLFSSHFHADNRNEAYAEDSDSVRSRKGLKQLEAEPRTPETPHPVHAFFDPDDLHKDSLGLSSSHFHADNKNGAYSEDSDSVRSKKSLKQLNVMFGSREVPSDHAKFAEGRVTKGLSFQEAEEEEQSLQDEVSQLSTENQNLKTQILSESERASKAETKVKTLNEALAKLEAEKEAGLLLHQQCLDRITNLESKVSHTQEDARKHDERANKAEIEAQTLKQALAKLEAEKEAGLLQNKQSLETISNLEGKISCEEESAQRLNDRVDKAEREVETLKQTLSVLNEEKEAVSLQYQQCLVKISNLETKISRAQEEAKRLNDEIMIGVTKLSSSEEQCLLLERSNQSLQLEVDTLVQKMGMQNQDFSEMQQELERLHICMQEERLRFVQAEAALQTLQNLHYESQEEQRALALELQHGVQMLKEMELRNQGLVDDIRLAKEENKNLNELNLASAMSIKNLQDEIFSLRETKRKLEEEVELRMDQRNALQQEIYCLKEEINDLNRRHRVVMKQVDSVGLDPENFGSSVKDLQDENSRLKEMCQKDRDEKVTLLGKLEVLEKLLEKNALLENSLSDVNAELEGLREKLKALEESCQDLVGEKSTLVVEKAKLVSQLGIIIENMEKLSEKNTFLENSLCDANVELEGLRTKFENLEESYQMLDNEKYVLLTERDTLVSQLETIQRRLEDLEKRYIELEEKCSGLEKEKESAVCQLVGMENQILLLQEEGRQRNKEFEEELDKAINAQVEIFILQKCIQDMEEKNFSLLIECQKHFEASKLSEKLISELEYEKIEKQVEAESLLDQIEKLRTEIQQVMKALEIAPDYGLEDKIEREQIILQHMLGKIDDTKNSLLKTQDEKLQLVVEKSVLVTLLSQLRLEASDLETDRNTLDQKFKIRTEQLMGLQNEKHELLDMNGQLRLEVRDGYQREKVLKYELENIHVKLSDMQGAYLIVQKENSEVLEENKSLMKEFSDLKEEKFMLEEENSVILGEAIALSNLSLIFKSFSTEKTVELKGLDEDLNCLHGVNRGLEKKVRVMEEKLEMVQMENLHLKESVEKFENELDRVRSVRDQLNYQIGIGNELLSQKEMEFSEVERILKATESEKTELQGNVEGLKSVCDEARVIREELERQILKLSEDSAHQNKEIGCLREANMRFESELGKLREECEELKTREENLSSKLQERRNEIELWEAEAAEFYGDLHLSTIHEGLLEEKIHELTGACESLEDESTSRSVDIELLKEKVSVLEGENGGLKTQLATYFPVIVSLRDSITSLEHHALLQTKPNTADNQEARDAVHLIDKSCQELSEDQSAVVPQGVSDLQELQTRIKAVEKAVLEMERFLMQESLNPNIKLEAAMKQIKELKSKNSLRRGRDVQTSRDVGVQPEEELGDEVSHDLELQQTEPERSKVRNGLLMKDIPLDQVSDCSSCGISMIDNGEADYQMLELSRTAEQDCSFDPTVNKAPNLASASTDFEAEEEQKREYPSSELQVEKELGVDKQEISKRVTEPRQDGNKRKILDRLVSDAQKLTNLQITVQDLKRKVEISENSKRAKGIEYDTVKGQLQEVEAVIMQLADTNGKLMKNVEESPLSSDGKATVGSEESVKLRRRVSERARGGSEKIGQLQLEVQKIQFVLLKLEADKESKGKARVSERRTRVLLRDYLYSTGKSNQRRKNEPFCACVRPPTTGD
ncbi:hypothetical protein HHK36_020582 [Tetracentron sinense]|uniref:NAB domain-containing protein n=1 Tax=Tetracentron sinense TaxID=13715 RepID=A0A834YRV3_TETSI|nr:hypothetical protein HHK36_020582 [Tetracentron sinense]